MLATERATNRYVVVDIIALHVTYMYNMYVCMYVSVIIKSCFRTIMFPGNFAYQIVCDSMITCMEICVCVCVCVCGRGSKSV